jgi:branched-chain amino acid transport system permease protein
MDFASNLSSTVVQGLLLGGLYALIALGLSLVFGVMKLINVAHGDLVIFGSYFLFAMFTSLGLDPLIALIPGIIVMFMIGYALQRVVLSRSFKVSMESPLIICFGLSIVFQNAFQIAFSPLSKSLTPDYAMQSIEILGMRLQVVWILDFVLALVVMLFLRQFLSKTYLGRAIRAASQERRAAKLVGINPERVYAYTFAIAMATAAIAGVCLGLTFPFTPTAGTNYLIIAFGVIVLGGMGSMMGTFVGGIIFGLAQTLGGQYVGSNMALLVAYLLVVVVLGARPQGLFSR